MTALVVTGGIVSMAAVVLLSQKAFTADMVYVITAFTSCEHPDSLAYINNVTLPFLSYSRIPFKRLMLGGSVNPHPFPSPTHAPDGSLLPYQCVQRKRASLLAKLAPIQPLRLLLCVTHESFLDPATLYPCPVDFPLFSHTSFGCQRIVQAARLPLPYRPRCWFCGFQTMTEWAMMKKDIPALYARAMALETQLAPARFFTPARAPLSASPHPLYANVSPPQSGLCFA